MASSGWQATPTLIVTCGPPLSSGIASIGRPDPARDLLGALARPQSGRITANSSPP